MKATFVGREKNEATFKMEFSAEDFESAIQKAYQKTRGKFSLDGFRQGKAPRKLIEAKYGDDIFYEDAINQLFADSYPVAVQEMELEPVDRPSAEFDQIEGGKGFGVTVKVTVAPVMELKEYKGIKVKKIDSEVNESDVDRDLEALQKRNSRMIIVDRAAQDGDTVLIDYAGFVGEDQFEGGTAERQPLTLGSNTFIPGFEEQLIGAMTGDDRDVKVTFPEDYHMDTLAGQEAIFKCKVHEIKETELPALDDDFAKDVSEFETLAELKEDTKKKLETTAKAKAEYETKNAVLEKIYEAHEVDIPEIMVEEQIDDMLQEFDQQLRYQGLDLAKYFEYLGRDIKEYRDEIRPDAFKKLKTRLLVEAVAKAEELKASDEEIENELTKMAEQYKMEPDKLREMMGIEGMSFLMKDIVNRRAVDFLFEQAVIEA
ncbi:MAG: trigger factor [Firmicutes bacterium HGW-Firmicutes-11]|jgi:trigger factor|nr:MAG: trigger factor [Firmicutes bacterium HGW-Firmicutes-11]